jgi:glycylpeptide N-tetradecanoyltransferase
LLLRVYSSSISSDIVVFMFSALASSLTLFLTHLCLLSLSLCLTPIAPPLVVAFIRTQTLTTHHQPPGEEKKLTEHGSIDVEKKVSDVSADPYPLPKGFVWDSVDVSDNKVLDEVYTLLFENYVEDDDNMFRFDYSREFLTWALTPPGFERVWHVGVRSAKSKRLLAFITGVPADMRVYSNAMPMVEINFLCVHKKLRALRLAPVLIKEVTRRVNRKNIWQAVYTAGVVLPKPVAQNRYYHRSLNPKKLIGVGFSRLSRNMTMSRTIKLYKVAPEPKIPGIRLMDEKDVPQACALLNKFLSKFKLHQHFSEAEFAHWLLPREGVIHTYVVENPDSHKITDMLSFYALPSTIIGNAKYSKLNAAYSYYNVAGKHTWLELMQDALILANQRSFDVFNALNVMENADFLEKLKFGIGDGNLQYYLYNWRCPEMVPSDVGLVLL